MHDPQTVAFDIKYPWWHTSRLGGKPWRYHSNFITIWHVDPEADGSDDSCGFSFVRLSKDDLAWAKEESGREFPFWFGEHGKFGLSLADNVGVMAAAWRAARRRAKGTFHWRSLSSREMAEIICLVSNPVDNLVHAIHEARTSPEALEKLFYLTLRIYRTRARRWYQKPRWHVGHWRIQVHPVMQFKRWAFSRCAGCHNGFGWGYAPTTGNWSGTGPQWFKSEDGMYHSECYPQPRPNRQASLDS